MASKRRRTTTGKPRWFSAKGLFKWTYSKTDRRHRRDHYEESIVVLKASSEEQAAERARKLFKRSEHADEELSVTFTGEWELIELFDPVREGREVYWLLRMSSLSPQKYVARYWDDGYPASCDQKGWTHSWYNYDGKRSACMNCREMRRGRLWKRQ